MKNTGRFFITTFLDFFLRITNEAKSSPGLVSNQGLRHSTFPAEQPGQAGQALFTLMNLQQFDNYRESTSI